jgi:hypothetical protein
MRRNGNEEVKPLDDLENILNSNMERRGSEINRDDLIRLAKGDEELIFDLEGEIVDILTENYKKEAPPGMSFLDWLDTKDKGYFLKIPLGLADGGTVISISDWLKHKEKPRIKRLNLDSVAPGKALADLTDAEREVVRNLLRMTLSNKD